MILRRSSLSAAALALSAFLSSCGKNEIATRVAANALPIVPVAAVQRMDLSRSTILTAEFEPFQEVELMAKVSGYVQSIKVDIGDQVKAGQLIAVLEVPEMQDDLSRATATIEQAEAETAAARDELARSESAYQIAHISFTRVQDLSKREPGLIPLQEVDEVRSRELIAQAQLSSAKSKLRVAQQRAQVARSDESRVRTMKNYVSITAPFAGTVTRRYANLGSLVQAGTSSQTQAMPLVRLSQNGLLRLRLPVPESMVPSVKVGRPVEVRVASLARSFEGRVARFTAKVDQATRTMLTEVDVPNASNLIVPGMYAEVTLGLEGRPQVLSVPLEAIERSASATRVFVVDGSGVVKIVPVKLGIEDAHNAEVQSGLQVGDQVMTAQRSGVKEGDHVQPKLVAAGQGK
ncbi:efflux RND transporter periplasmic adaptor subunit [Bryobacter aggregatus]|uniref:efflux RND transporter periplasmic adaptor subunit n=1 Tax=Bryobacter aggregatus TaxID=360054 RepID=UPI0004E276D6|nr:efflux RND transporter periplasmic adaptor subunit [Bryobacter aggregatus]